MREERRDLEHRIAAGLVGICIADGENHVGYVYITTAWAKRLAKGIMRLFAETGYFDPEPRCPVCGNECPDCVPNEPDYADIAEARALDRRPAVWNHQYYDGTP